MDISRLVNPHSIAVVGATDRPGSYAHNTLLNLIRNGYAGSVIGVHPNRKEVLSFYCVPSIGDLSEPVDVVVIATPADSVPAYLTAARQLGCGGAVVFAASGRPRPRLAPAGAAGPAELGSPQPPPQLGVGSHQKPGPGSTAGSRGQWRSWQARSASAA